jgi:hypothetical protein
LGRGGDVEGLAADYREEVDINEAGDERELVGGYARAGLKVAPSVSGQYQLRERKGWVTYSKQY